MYQDIKVGDEVIRRAVGWDSKPEKGVVVKVNSAVVVIKFKTEKFGSDEMALARVVTSGKIDGRKMRTFKFEMKRKMRKNDSKIKIIESDDVY